MYSWTASVRVPGLAIVYGITEEKIMGPGGGEADKKRNSWKGRYLSMGGCVTLISQFSLASLHIFSCFGCSMSVV